MPAPVRLRTLLLPLLAWPCVLLAQATPPAPAAAKPEYRVTQVRPNLVVLSSGGSNVVAWTGAGGPVLVDDGSAAQAPQLLEALARLSKSPARFVIDTHGHPDHTGGNEALAKAGAILVGHEGTREHLSQSQVDEDSGAKIPAAPGLALPIVTFAESMALQFEGERIALVHVASAHSDSDVVVRWQEADAIAVGDLFWNGSYPNIDLAQGGSLAGSVAAIEAVLARIDAQTAVIPGHGPVATRADLAAYRDMLVAVGRRVRAQVEAGSSLDEVLAVKPSAEFDERYGKGAVSPERFIRTLYRDLARPRSTR